MSFLNIKRKVNDYSTDLDIGGTIDRNGEFTPLTKGQKSYRYGFIQAFKSINSCKRKNNIYKYKNKKNNSSNKLNGGFEEL